MNVIHKIGVILFLLCPYISLYGQEGRDTLTFRIVSYNVENLFDSRHDTLKNDYEFLPDATRHWNYSKYRKKLDNIARVIIATGGWTPPALVALCEVENDSVMRDLTRYSALHEADYRYVMTQSPDERGVSCIGCLWHASPFGQPVAGKVQILLPLPNGMGNELPVHQAYPGSATIR